MARIYRRTIQKRSSAKSLQSCLTLCDPIDDPDNHNGVIIHLEPNILECKVKWALGSITMNKDSGGDGIPVELFQILKDVVKMLHSICQQIWKTQQCHRTGEGQFSFQSQRKVMPKNPQTTPQSCSSQMIVKYCSKLSKPGFSNTWITNFQMFKLDLKKGEEPEIKLPTSAGSLKSKRIPEKNLLHWLRQNFQLCESQQTVENSFKRWNTRPPYLPLEKPVCRSRSNSYNQTWNNGLVPNWESSRSRLYIVSLLI